MKVTRDPERVDEETRRRRGEREVGRSEEIKRKEEWSFKTFTTSTPDQKW